MITLSSAIALLALSPGAAPQSVTLRYKFSPGTSHDYRMQMTYNMKMGTQGRTMPMNMASTMSVRQSVVSVNSQGVGTLSTRTTPSSMTMNGKPAGNASKPVTATLKMSPTGQMSGLSSPALASSPLSGLGQLQGGEIVPSGPVHIGSQWTSTMSMGAAKMNVSNKVTSISTSSGNTMVTVQLAGSGDIAKLAGAMLGQAMPNMKMTGGFTYSGSYVFNATKGFLVKQAGGAQINSRITMPNPQTHQPTTMTMAGTFSMVMTLVR